MVPPMNRLIAAASLALLLTACGGDGGYPSLARRDAEQVTGTAEPAPGPTEQAPPAPPSPELSSRLAQLVAKARGAHQRFTGEQGRTERLVAGARGAAVASESWSVATVALASLESARSEAMISLADLDTLNASERIAAAGGGSQSDLAAVTAARNQVIALVAQEDAVLSRLRGAVRA